MSDETVGPVKAATIPPQPIRPALKAAVKRPPAILCSSCARRALGAVAGASSPQLGFNNLAFEAEFENRLDVFKLKLRDWLNVERIEMRPCLSVCPAIGITVERRGKTLVLDQSAIDAVEKQFDPTRQLSLFDEP
ncbi:hypothetical protein BH10BDE1_BH10BDE1_01170 [soil metagenome]